MFSRRNPPPESPTTAPIGIELSQPWPDHILSIVDADGRALLRIEWDGTVTGTIEDASEAAAVFVAELRHIIGACRFGVAGRSA